MRWTVVTNCDTFFITKCDTVYYKLRQVLQSAMDLLQIATGITKCDDYYKLRQYINDKIRDPRQTNMPPGHFLKLQAVGINFEKLLG